MRIKSGNHVFCVSLEDDGTMDTVISVYPKNERLYKKHGCQWVRFDGEFASCYRRKTGEMTKTGLRELGHEAIDAYYESHEL